MNAVGTGVGLEDSRLARVNRGELHVLNVCVTCAIEMDVVDGEK